MTHTTIMKKSEQVAPWRKQELKWLVEDSVAVGKSNQGCEEWELFVARKSDSSSCGNLFRFEFTMGQNPRLFADELKQIAIDTGRDTNKWFPIVEALREFDYDKLGEPVNRSLRKKFWKDEERQISMPAHG